ncbi:putative glutamate/gamma-aminobutyrate antiporter [Shimia sp. SK013]|uniref:APC family permease n=1 Tax=Shimia sp. SK013 TaxID=1389006 RepID=UPI0006B57278|nr:APC family permease [Shimia sp. SK013]KPA21258.1 putative glutamate/gamma-aminobutyrate antiporter [Shimia sp. SK013]
MESAPAKKIGLLGIIFFVFSGMIGFDGLAATAAVGPSVFGWWVVVIVLFLIPNLLMTSELGTAFPSDGAIYDWAHKALGPRHAARVGWFYWINVPFWMPAVYLIASGILSLLFFPDASVWVQIFIAIAMVWITVFICNAPAATSNMVNYVGGTAKVIVLMALIIGGINFVSTHGAANEISLETMMPRFDEGFRYAPTLVYLIVGAETVACLGGSLRNPRRNIPLGLFLAVSFILVLYSLAIGAIMVALPTNELSLVGGITQTFSILFGDSAAGRALTVSMSLVAIAALMVYIVPWLMASSRAAAEGADGKEMPAIFGKRNASGSPVGANLLTGVVATIALVVYGLMSGSADELFWSLFAFASFLLFVTYFFMIASFVKLRETHADTPRPFRVPGGKFGVWTVALMQGLVLVVSCLVFAFPDIMFGVIDLGDSAPILGGILGSFLFIEYSVRRMVPKNQPTKSSALSPS